MKNVNYIKMLKIKIWVSQAVIPPVYLPVFLFFWDRCALPHNPNILTFTSLSISKSSSFAGTVIRTLGVMTNGVGITQRWRSSALVNICKKRKMSGTAFFQDYLRIINKGSLPQRKGNFILPPPLDLHWSIVIPHLSSRFGQSTQIKCVITNFFRHVRQIVLP